MQTIRHDPISRTIIAYLATFDAPVPSAQIVAYMELLHNTERDRVDLALMALTDSGGVLKVSRGVYAARWAVVARGVWRGRGVG